MTTGGDVFRQIQAAARSSAAKGQAPTQEYLTRHALESFLDRLTRTEHADGFVLKGGILLAGYGFRRSTKDVDANAVSASVTPAHIGDIVRDVAEVAAADGVVFDTDSIDVQDIRDQAEYPGLRMHVKVSIGSWVGKVAWDVSTGDPIVPTPKMVTIDRLIGDPIQLLGYAPETTIAEKGVTILERGITSTRWRDYIDIVQLAVRGIDDQELLRSARAVARYRKVTLGPVTPFLVGYGAVGQPKWAAWRRKERLEESSEMLLDDQVARVASFLDPVFSLGPDPDE